MKQHVASTVILPITTYINYSSNPLIVPENILLHQDQMYWQVTQPSRKRSPDVL